MFYVASPYTHDAAEVREHRFQHTRNFVVHSLNQKYVVFSPIVYLHEIARIANLPKDAEFWKNFNNNMLRIANGMFVLKLIGWEISKGVQYEISIAQTLDIPITYIDFHHERFPVGHSL